MHCSTKRTINKTKMQLQRFIRDFVFGMEDGLVSNLGLVLGVYVGGGSQFAILLAGLASMFAGAFSMSAGTYLSAKSQREVYEHEIDHAKKSLKTNPQKYLKEMRKILRLEGFSKQEVSILIRHFEHHNPTTFVTNYIQKKVGITKDKLDAPLRNAGVMFLSFLAGSAFPVFPFFLQNTSLAAKIAISLTIIVLFSVGVAKTKFTHRSKFKSGFEIAAVGIGAGVIGYLVGLILSLI
jgi:VIT1/CCC1 family predicted Fe2+/Mn2+ transporter